MSAVRHKYIPNPQDILFSYSVTFFIWLTLIHIFIPRRQNRFDILNKRILILVFRSL